MGIKNVLKRKNNILREKKKHFEKPNTYKKYIGKIVNIFYIEI